jgi:hypothetical protein
MIERVDGQLEIDTDKGIIYFHAAKTGRTGRTIMRICRVPYLSNFNPQLDVIDITHMVGSSVTNVDE